MSKKVFVDKLNESMTVGSQRNKKKPRKHIVKFTFAFSFLENQIKTARHRGQQPSQF